MAHLKSMSCDEFNLKPVDKIQFSSYVKKLTSFKFVLHIVFYEYLLNQLASFSCSLQTDSVDLLFCIAKLKSLLSSLEYLKGDTLDPTSELAKVIMSVDCEQHRAEFREFMFSAVRQNVLDAFHNSQSAYIDAISACLENRFDDLQPSSVMKGVKILHVSAWPSDDSRDSFGAEEISGVIEHFKPLLKHDIAMASITDDWRAFKTYWAGAKQIKGTNIWALLLRCHRKQFPNLASLIEILLLLVSNAKVEQGFSSMRRIKPDSRSRLGERTLDNLMRIGVEGPAVSDFSSDVAVKRFFAQPRRPDVLSYGPRKRTHDESESES